MELKFDIVRKEQFQYFEGIWEAVHEWFLRFPPDVCSRDPSKMVCFNPSHDGIIRGWHTLD